MGFDHAELPQLVTEVGARDEVSLIELNFSCPNVETGLIMGADPAETAAAVDVRPLTTKPLIVKLTPNATEPAAVAQAAEQSGADAVSLINTLKGMALHPRTHEPWLGGVTGGLSGPGGARGGARAGPFGVPLGPDPRDRHGRDRQRARRRRLSQRRRQLRRGGHRKLPRPAPPGPASRPSWSWFPAKSGSFPRVLCARRTTWHKAPAKRDKTLN